MPHRLHERRGRMQPGPAVVELLPWHVDKGSVGENSSMPMLRARRRKGVRPFVREQPRQMRCPAFRAAGLPVGSGVVESARKLRQLYAMGGGLAATEARPAR